MSKEAVTQALDALRKALAQQAQPTQQEPVAKSLLANLYNTGYKDGHYDTVEGQYTDVHQSDMDTYHLDVVANWLEENPPAQEQVTHAIIAGALFDFMGWLTSRKERLSLSSSDDASPVVMAITEFAKMRKLSLEDAKVTDWNATLQSPAQRTWVGLTDDEIDDIFKLNHRRLGGWDYNGDDVMYDEHFESAVAAIEAKLKEKNT